VKKDEVKDKTKKQNDILTFQFILAFIMIGRSLIFIQNAVYQKNLDWGYNQEQVLDPGPPISKERPSMSLGGKKFIEFDPMSVFTVIGNRIFIH